MAAALLWLSSCKAEEPEAQFGLIGVHVHYSTLIREVLTINGHEHRPTTEQCEGSERHWSTQP